MTAVCITDNQTGFVRYEHARSLVYDLIEKKKINTLKEYFGGADPEALIQKYCEENKLNDEMNISDMFTEDGLEYLYQAVSEKGFEDSGSLDDNMLFYSKEEFIRMINEDRISCSVDEMKEANQVSVFLWYNKTIYGHTATCIINLPPEMMNSRYFDSEKIFRFLKIREIIRLLVPEL